MVVIMLFCSSSESEACGPVTRDIQGALVGLDYVVGFYLQ
jgi:hypothetical protein